MTYEVPLYVAGKNPSEDGNIQEFLSWNFSFPFLN